MKLTTGRVVAVTAVAIAAAGAAWALRPETIAVDAAAVERGTVRVTVDEDGQTRVRDRYLLSAPVTGRLQRLDCEVGDPVATGEVFARIYPLPLDTRSRAEAVARLEGAEASQSAAAARVRQAEEGWGEARRHLERVERVAVEGGLSREQLDRAQVAERTAALELEAARGVADAALQATRAARAALIAGEGEPAGQPTLVRAPAAGRVLRLFEECERPVLAGSPIAEIGDPSRLEIVVDVLSQDAASIEPGAPMLVLASPEGDTLPARVRSVEPAAFTRVSPLGIEEQRVNVIGEFTGAAPILGDGFRVDAAIVVWEGADVLRVPVSALFRADEGWAVFVVEEGRARVRGVEIGARGHGMAEALSGLAEGEVVILYPGENVREGARVQADG